MHMKIMITYHLCKSNQNKLLLVRFLNLASNDFIIPGTIIRSCNINLSQTIGWQPQYLCLLQKTVGLWVNKINAIYRGLLTKKISEKTV